MATARIALAAPAGSLQGLQREAEAIKVSPCVEDARLTLVKLISESANAIILFMAKQEVAGMAYQIVTRPRLIPEFESAVSYAHCT